MESLLSHLFIQTATHARCSASRALCLNRRGKLTDDDLDKADGHREYLVGKLQERYGMAKDKAEEEVEKFESAL